MTAGSNASPKSSRKSPRRRSISSGNHGAPLRFEPTALQWENMEQGLGKPIEGELRDKLTKIADNYLYWEPMERSAPFCIDEESYLVTIRDRCKKLADIIAKQSSTAEETAINKLSVRFNRIDKMSVDNDFADQYPSEIDKFKQYLARMIHDCNEEIKISQSEDGNLEGHSWNLMVHKITDLFKVVGFPTSASNDSRKSSFVNFMRLFQVAFPATSTTKGLHSDDALKSAIHRARKSARGATAHA